MASQIVRWAVLRRYALHGWRMDFLIIDVVTGGAIILYHRSAMERDALMSLSPCPTVPNCRALVRAVCSSAWIGTMRSLPPLSSRAQIVGRSVSSDRSRSSTASASGISLVRPALYEEQQPCPRVTGTLISASTSWGSPGTAISGTGRQIKIRAS